MSLSLPIEGRQVAGITMPQVGLLLQHKGMVVR